MIGLPTAPNLLRADRIGRSGDRADPIRKSNGSIVSKIDSTVRLDGPSSSTGFGLSHARPVEARSWGELLTILLSALRRIQIDSELALKELLNESLTGIMRFRINPHRSLSTSTPPNIDDMALPVCSAQTTAATDYLLPARRGRGPGEVTTRLYPRASLQTGVELTRPAASMLALFATRVGANQRTLTTTDRGVAGGPTSLKKTEVVIHAAGRW